MPPDASASWPAALAAVEMMPPDHVVKFYSDDESLVDLVATYLSDGLRSGDAGLVLAAAAHHEAIAERLARRQAEGARVVVLDASEVIGRFMIDGCLDQTRLRATVGRLVASQVKAASTGKLRIYSAMADLLYRDGQAEAADRLEQLWTALEREHGFALLCAYAVDTFAGRPDALRGVCEAHSSVLLDAPVATSAGGTSQLVAEIGRRIEVERTLRSAIAQLSRQESNLRRDIAERHAADVAQRQAEVVQAAAIDRSERLLRITGAIANAITEQQVFEATVDHVAAALGASTAALWLVDGHNMLNLVRAVGYTGGESAAFGRVAADAAPTFPALDAFQRRESIWITSVEALVARYPGLNSAVMPGRDYRVACLPLMSQGRALGALCLTIERDDPVDEERSFLTLVAGYASQAVERLRLLESELKGRTIAEQLYQFAQAVMAAGQLDHVLDAALDAIQLTLGTSRAAILIADGDGVMRFRAWRQLSDEYRLAVDGHSPWASDDPSPLPALVANAAADSAFIPYRELFAREGIGALAFVPLVSGGRLLGKFMVYYPTPHDFSESDVAITRAIANHLASVIARFSAVAELEETIRLNELFAGALAHDLRNPLNAMMTAAHAAAVAARSPGSPADLPTAQILTSGQRMARMIEQLLDLTVARADGRIRIQPRETSLCTLCDDAVSELRMAHPAWRFERSDRGDLRGTWDPDRLLQVLSNVVANAGQHGRPDGSIRIELDGSDADVVRMAVSNRGVIPDDVLPSIFDPLRRSRHHRRDAPGLGLGLFIVRELVRSHHGSVSVESDPTRETTTATIVLPRGGSSPGYASATGPAASRYQPNVKTLPVDRR